MGRVHRSAALVVSFVMTLGTVYAQQADTLEAVLPEVRIEAARATETEASAPFAVAVLRREVAAVALEPSLSLASVLAGLPGVWINDRSHYALGERLVIRGMGWRAAFGVRGVQALLDGIPLALPDGQAVLDIADPVFVRQAEVVRGPASLFWGNGSGGVLFLSTAPSADSASTRLRFLGGSYGLRQAAAEITVPLARHRLSGSVSDVRRDGYRAHSDGGFTRAALHGDFDLGSRTRLRTHAALAVQDTDAPGALTREEATADPRQADARYVRTSSGKKSTQTQAGATLQHQLRFGLFSATAYGLLRRLDNPLPFAFIDLDRRAGGARLHLQQQTGRLDWGAGLDAGWQHDDRRNLNNDDGTPGNEIDLDQGETVRSLATFARLALTLTAKLRLSAGLRFDAIRFALDDHLLGDGDQSGARSFSAWSPAAGLSYEAGPALLFANVSTAFETPTTTELVNRPGGASGFNPDLEPQRTRGVEVGARGAWPTVHLTFDLAVFRLNIRDRLLPFQNDEGRTFFRNAGANTHDGVEASLLWVPRPRLSVRCSYTGSRFIFDEEPLDGNRIPGVPFHHVYAHVRAVHGGLWSQFAVEYASDAYADDANTTENDSYVVAELHFGHTSLWIGDVRVQPFVEVRNLFDVSYNGSLVINANGERFFEPAPGRIVQGGVGITF